MLDLSPVLSRTVHAVCRREVCSGTCSLSLIFIPSFVSQTNSVCLSVSTQLDDTQLYVALSKKAVNDAVTNLQNCLFDVHTSFIQNGLVNNPEKSEAVLLSAMQHARATSSPLTDVNVAGSIVPLTDTVKLLGVTIDRHLTFDSHVLNVCKSAYYHIRALKHIGSSLFTDMAKTVASALVNSRLYYANSVLYNTSSATC